MGFRIAEVGKCPPCKGSGLEIMDLTTQCSKGHGARRMMSQWSNSAVHV